MDAISLIQPLAQLLVLGEKQIETRTYRPRKVAAGQVLLVHASKTESPRFRRIYEQDWCYRLLAKHGYRTWESLPKGAHVGAVTYMGSETTEAIVAGTYPLLEPLVSHAPTRGLAFPFFTEQERALGDYGPKRYGWMTTKPKLLTQPVPDRGQVFIWTVPDEIRREVIRRFHDSGVTLL